MPKTWLITGASRGLGAEIAKAALGAGHRVIAAGRRREAVVKVLGPDRDQLLSVALDVTLPDQAGSAVDAGLSRFGSIDVLVNNAGYGHLGFFEETSSEDVQAQFATNLFGAFSVTRAVLPAMRRARKGHIFNISSIAGIRGVEFGSLYCASKFALEGFSEALSTEVAPFGIAVTIVEPGPFRTDFLAPESLRVAAHAVADYDERRARLQSTFEERNGQQAGDPAKLASALVKLAGETKPPLRFAAGAFAVETANTKLAGMRAEIERWRQMSIDTDYRAPT
jgi:NAD(P)-dependent dehydrogenase (short-subunit alcohol dehydrogenase family)